MTIRTLATALLLLLVAPGAALACPVCGLAGPGNNGLAYLIMTLVLSALPVAMIGGVFYWVYRRTTEAEARETTADRHPAVPHSNR